MKTADEMSSWEVFAYRDLHGPIVKKCLSFHHYTIIYVVRHQKLVRVSPKNKRSERVKEAVLREMTESHSFTEGTCVLSVCPAWSRFQ